MACAGSTYEFRCEPGYVMWIGQGMNWGVMYDKDRPTSQCRISLQDCFIHETSNDFIDVSIFFPLLCALCTMALHFIALRIALCGGYMHVL